MLPKMKKAQGHQILSLRPPSKLRSISVATMLPHKSILCQLKMKKTHKIENVYSKHKKEEHGFVEKDGFLPRHFTFGARPAIINYVQ